MWVLLNKIDKPTKIMHNLIGKENYFIFIFIAFFYR